MMVNDSNETGNGSVVVMNPKETTKSLSEVSVEPFRRFRSQESHIIKIVGI